MCVFVCVCVHAHIVSQRSVLPVTLRNTIHFHLDRLFPWPVVLLVDLSLSPALDLQVHTTIPTFIVFMWILSIQLRSSCLQGKYFIPILSPNIWGLTEDRHQPQMEIARIFQEYT